MYTMQRVLYIVNMIYNNTKAIYLLSSDFFLNFLFIFIYDYSITSKTCGFVIFFHCFNCFSLLKSYLYFKAFVNGCLYFIVLDNVLL